MIDWFIVDLNGDSINSKVSKFANLFIPAKSKESYWKYTYEVSGLKLYTEESSTQYKQIDHYWSYVGELVGGDGQPKYTLYC